MVLGRIIEKFKLKKSEIKVSKRNINSNRRLNVGMEYEIKWFIKKEDITFWSGKFFRNEHKQTEK